MARSAEASRIARLRFRHLQLLMEMRGGATIRQAAEATNVTQPAVTKALQEIEEIFDCPLFHRTRRGLVPTSEGAVLLRGAELLLNDLRHVGESVDAAARGAVTTLRLGAPPFVATSVVPAILRSMYLEHGTSVKVILSEATSPRLFGLLWSGALDALITRFPEASASMPADMAEQLVFRKIKEDELQVLLPARHPLAGRDRIPVQALSDERWIVPSAESSTRLALNERFRREGILPPVPLVESNAVATIMSLVAAGLGIAAWPATAARLVDALPDLALRSLKPRLAAAPLGLFFRKSRGHDVGIQWLQRLIGPARGRG